MVIASESLSSILVYQLMAFLHLRFIVDEMNGRLTIIDAKRVDEGELKCVAENRAGKIQHAAFLKVSLFLAFKILAILY